MDSIKGYKEFLKQKLTQKRYIHSLSVAQTAARLASMYGADKEKAYLAGMLHDYARDLSTTELLTIGQAYDLVHYHVEVVNPTLLHGVVGAFLLEQEGIIKDEEILESIRYHTTSHPDSDLLGKILYIADYIEPNRDFPGVDKMRTMTYQNLDYGMLGGLDHTIMYLMQSAAFIHPLSIEARNRLIEKINIKHCN